MTHRERLEAKLAKREDWGEKRKRRADQAFGAASKIADNIPLGQPILVGHHSEAHARKDVERIRSAMSRGCESTKMAEHHAQCADGIARQLQRSVFCDDVDAIEQLEARIAKNEATRDRMKRVNSMYRKADAAGLAALGLDLEELRARVAHVGLSCVKVPYESYKLTNIGARINADRKRVKDVKERHDRIAQAASAAGGMLVEGEGDYVRVTFAQKPSQTTLDALRAADFTWSSGSWFGYSSRLPEVTP